MNDKASGHISSHLGQDVKEIKIPLPYGYIAARAWGVPGGDHCLALHGWQDNAGSFDMLIPQLVSNLYIIAIDIIGHGLSSHKPVGTPYFYMEFVYHVKCVAEYLNWNKFNIIGHSMGSSIGIVFASLYPNMINKLVCIDLIKPVTHATNIIPAALRASLELYRDAEKKTTYTQPSYSETEIIKRLTESRNNAISEHSARILTKRGVKKLENGTFVFSRDIRVKDIWNSGINCFDVMAKIVSGIKCELLIIKAKGSSTYSDEASLECFLEIYKKHCSRFELIEIDGNHFIHLEHPERVAPFINKFFLQKHSFL